MFWKNDLKSRFSTQKLPQITLFYPKTRHFRKTTLYVVAVLSIFWGHLVRDLCWDGLLVFFLFLLLWVLSPWVLVREGVFFSEILEFAVFWCFCRICFSPSSSRKMNFFYLPYKIMKKGVFSVFLFLVCRYSVANFWFSK